MSHPKTTSKLTGVDEFYKDMKPQDLFSAHCTWFSLCFKRARWRAECPLVRMMRVGFRGLRLSSSIYRVLVCFKGIVIY